MTPAFVQKEGAGGDAVSSTSVVMSPSVVAAVGNTLIYCVSTNGAAGNTASMADNSTSPGDPNVYQYLFGSNVNVGGNTGLHVFLCHRTRAVQTSDVITCTLSATTSRKSIVGCEYSGIIYPVVTDWGRGSGTTTNMSTGQARASAVPFMSIICVSNNLGATAGGVIASPSGFPTGQFGNNSGGATVQKEAYINHKVWTTTVGYINTQIPTDATDPTTGWISALLTLAEGFGMDTKPSRGGYAT